MVECVKRIHFKDTQGKHRVVEAPMEFDTSDVVKARKELKSATGIEARGAVLYTLREVTEDCNPNDDGPSDLVA